MVTRDSEQQQDVRLEVVATKHPGPARSANKRLSERMSGDVGSPQVCVYTTYMSLSLSPHLLHEVWYGRSVEF